MQVLGCLGIIALAIGLSAGITALIAIPVTWALNTFTQLHPTFLTVFVILWIASMLFGGAGKATVKKS